MEKTIQATTPAPLHYLVTGGTGFIGSALCRCLRAQGHALTILSRQSEKLAARSGAGVAAGVQYVGRIADLAPETNFDVVINLAGEPVVGPRWTAQRRAALHASRRDLTAELVRWIEGAQRRPRRMISASAIGYYGVQDEGDLRALREDAPAQNIFMSELCREWEAAALAARSLGVAVSIVRLGVVLAPLYEGKGALPKMVLPLEWGLAGQIGNGRQVVSWVHRDDVIGAIEYLQTLPPAQAEGVYNLCAPEPCSQAAFMKAAAHGMRSRLRLPVATPAWLLQLALGEQAGLLTQGQRVVPHRLLDSGYQFQWPVLSGALEDCLHG